MIRAMRAGVVACAGAALALVLVPALPSCGEPFELPCRITDQRVVLPTSVTMDRGDAIALSEGVGGDVIVLWLGADSRRADAGAPESGAGDGGDGGNGGGGDGGDGGDGGVSAATIIVPEASVAVIASDGTPRLTHTFPPPAALSARRGSTDEIGATFTGDGALFHWIETTTSTAPDGTTTKTAAAKVQRVGLDGREGAVMASAALACVRCSLTTVHATTGSTTAAIVREQPDLGLDPSARPRTTLVAFDANGATTATFDLGSLAGEPAGAPTPALGSPGGFGAAGLKLYARGGRFFAVVGRNAAVFDTSLVMVAGPWPVPSPNAEIDVEGRDLAMSWIGQLSSGDAAAAASVGDIPDLLFEARNASGAHIGPTRISTTSRLDLIRRNAGRAGVIHRQATTTYFTLVGDDGRKVGGDHPLGSAVDPALAAFAASEGVAVTDVSFDEATRSQLLFPVDRTHFVVWTGSNDVLREVLTCDP